MFGVELTQPAVGDEQAPSTMHLSFDFLVGDWASLLLLIRHWEQEYAGQDLPPPGPLQFRDHVVWERGRRGGGEYRRAREYWQTRIPTLPRAPQLPLTAASGGGDGSGGEGARWAGTSHLLPRPQWTALADRAREHGLTPTAAVLACYADAL